ncbi:coiled-coil domain-containing protein 157-like isoform X2 [Nyctibius grandis]|uniref:coiled-coil domain-containing protein 157-like isoform X2 n=1 Tax=Nyctibius grandis TaxID=48427 RepID=UPI0035BBF330
MAHLLGDPGCMQSLRADLGDLQAAIADVSSRVGAVRFPSWKFPHKVSCDLDLPALLQRYSYTENDPEYNQYSHVMLLELVTDRLLLLLQSFTGYAENVLSERAVPPAQAVGPCMSAGLTVTRYWSSMLKLGASYQQLLAEKAGTKEMPTVPSAPHARKPKKQHPKHSLPDVLELRESTEAAKSTPLCPSPSARAPDSDASGSSLPRAACSTAESSRSIATQTAGSSLGPCDTCTSAQAGLRDIGKAITSICQSQNIPSALSKFQERVEETTATVTLSATDVSCWASEQGKDLSRISQHLQMLLQQVKPLKAELEESQKQKEELRKQVEDFSRLLQAQKEARAQQREEAERNLHVKNKEHLEAVARLERDKDDLRRGAALLEERFCALKEELAAKQAAVQELEVSKTTLLEEMSTMVARSRVLELEEKVQLLSSQQESLGQELSTTTTQLEKEKAKVESVLRHEESLQAKQRVLLQHLDSLDQEREELQASLGAAEEDKARLAEQLEESRERSGQQLRAQQELLDTLQREKLSLEQSVSELRANVSRLQELARELKERERLLVLYPELPGTASVPWLGQAPVQLATAPLGRQEGSCQPLRAGRQRQAELPLVPPGRRVLSAGTGSLTEEMEKQLQANSIRISVLAEQNARLGSALAKVKAAAEQGVLKLIPQTQPRPRVSPQCGGEAGGQDAGQPSCRGGRDCAEEARQGAPRGQLPKLLSVEPTGKAGPCLSLLGDGLVPVPPRYPRARGRACPHSLRRILVPRK